MPKLHEKLDGDYVIRTFAEVHHGNTKNGTWQIHASGLDVLRQEGIAKDGDDVPIRLFHYMRTAKLIYTLSGGTASLTKKLVPPPKTPSTVKKQPKPVAPSFSFAPILRFVFNDDRSWHITASLNHLCQPYWTEQVEPLRRLIGDAVNGRICVGDATLWVNALSLENPFDSCTTPVGLSTDQYNARLRGKRPDGSNLSVQIGYTRGICASGTLFTFHGRRLGLNEPAAWGESYYIVLQTLYTDPNPLLDACQPLRLIRRIPWCAYRIRLPPMPDQCVHTYLAGIGHAPHTTEESEE